MIGQSRTEKAENQELRKERGTYDGVTEREVKAEHGRAAVDGGERRRKW